jgi:hypothetical protein
VIPRCSSTAPLSVVECLDQGILMAHLWVRTTSDNWGTVPVEEASFDLATLVPHPVAVPTADRDLTRSVLLLRCRSEKESWLLICRSIPNVCVNGFPVSLGIRVLEDRDELWIPGLPAVFFSTETVAQITTFQGSREQIICPRCKQEIEKDTSAVKCPQCSVWHHQSDELPCWTYAAHCTLCDQPTGLDTGYRWSPEVL